MPTKNSDLHGSAPDKAKTALIIIDFLNELDFPEGPELLKNALPAVHRVAAFKRYLKQQKVPVIYANDNFGKWRSSHLDLVTHCLKKNCLGRDLAKKIVPDKDDYFVLKPKHSAFYATPLETLLLYLGAKQLILTGIAGNLCVLHTALDAHVRDYKIFVPADCTASNTVHENNTALEHLKSILHLETKASTEFIQKKRKF